LKKTGKRITKIVGTYYQKIIDLLIKEIDLLSIIAKEHCGIYEMKFKFKIPHFFILKDKIII
jgi:hypothetical protein